MSDSIITVYVYIPTEYMIIKPELFIELVAQTKHAICKIKAADVEQTSVVVQFGLAYGPTKVVSGRWYVPEKIGSSRTPAWVNAVSDDLAQSYRRCLAQFKLEPERVVFTGKLDNTQYHQGIA